MSAKLDDKAVIDADVAETLCGLAKRRGMDVNAYLWMLVDAERELIDDGRTEPAKGGDEHDAFCKGCRKILKGLERPGVKKQAKRTYNERVRRAGSQRDLVDALLESNE